MTTQISQYQPFDKSSVTICPCVVSASRNGLTNNTINFITLFGNFGWKYMLHLTVMQCIKQVLRYYNNQQELVHHYCIQHKPTTGQGKVTTASKAALQKLDFLWKVNGFHIRNRCIFRFCCSGCLLSMHIVYIELQHDSCTKKHFNIKDTWHYKRFLSNVKKKKIPIPDIRHFSGMCIILNTCNIKCACLNWLLLWTS